MPDQGQQRLPGVQCRGAPGPGNLGGGAETPPGEVVKTPPPADAARIVENAVMRCGLASASLTPGMSVQQAFARIRHHFNLPPGESPVVFLEYDQVSSSGPGKASGTTRKIEPEEVVRAGTVIEILPEKLGTKGEGE